MRKDLIDSDEEEDDEVVDSVPSKQFSYSPPASKVQFTLSARDINISQQHLIGNRTKAQTEKASSHIVVPSRPQKNAPAPINHYDDQGYISLRSRFTTLRKIEDRDLEQPLHESVLNSVVTPQDFASGKAVMLIEVFGETRAGFKIVKT